MSAPLVVNTRDGVCWTRRTVTSGGIALYAPESVKTCPDFVMATEAELAEHGIVGSAYALPMPVGPERKSRGVLDRARDAVDARMSKDALRHVLQNVISYAARLENRVAELETFAHGCDAEGCVLPHSSWCERAKKTAAENDGCTCGKPWVGHPQPHAAHCWTVSPPRDEVEKLRARVAELEAEGARLRLAWRVARARARLKNGALQVSSRARRRLWVRVAELEAAAKEIQRLHTDSPMGPCPVCIDGDAMVRGEDYTLPYPCPTARLAGAKDCDPPSHRKAPRPPAGPKPTPMTVYLATPCATCDHTLNWHRNDVGCTVDDCACGRFAEPASMGGDR